MVVVVLVTLKLAIIDTLIIFRNDFESIGYMYFDEKFNNLDWTQFVRTKPMVKGHIERRFWPIVLDHSSIYSSIHPFIHPLLSVCQGENLGTKLGNFDGERERSLLLLVLFFSHMNLLLLNLGFEE